MSAVGTDADLLERIEAYFDAAPRAAADVEEHGALTLFVSRIPWRFYGRPRLGLAEDVGADDVAAVRARQRELGVREAFEWVHETTPSLAGAARGGRAEVMRVPLLALDAGALGAARRAGRRRPCACSAPTTAALRRRAGGRRARVRRERGRRGRAGARARRRATSRPARLGDLGFLRERLRRGLTAMAVAESEPRARSPPARTSRSATSARSRASARCPPRAGAGSAPR